MIDTVPIDLSGLSVELRSAFISFVHTAQKQGFDNDYIATKLSRQLTIEYYAIRKLLLEDSQAQGTE